MTKALQKELSALVAEYKSTSDSLTALQGKMADLTAQAKQDEVQYQTQKTQLLKEIAQAQQQISVALEPGAVSTTQPDGYSQGQLAYLQSHQALVPSGDAVIAQGGKYFLGHVVDGSEAPIVSHIVGADPTQGDPGFIVGNRWYGTLAAAEAASRATGMPWNGAVNIDPSEFDNYIAKIASSVASKGTNATASAARSSSATSSSGLSQYDRRVNASGGQYLDHQYVRGHYNNSGSYDLSNPNDTNSSAVQTAAYQAHHVVTDFNGVGRVQTVASALADATAQDIANLGGRQAYLDYLDFNAGLPAGTE